MTNSARRLGLAVAGVGFAALAAFATASPAAADNGPHVLLSGSMVSSADGCAGCHRMHGANVGADELFRNAAEGTAFCYTCHSGGTGATTNVRDGVSTAGSLTDIDSNAMSTHTSSYLNLALRAGGFDNNRVGASAAVQANIYYNAARASWSPNKYAATSQSGVHPNAYGEYVWGDLIPAASSKTTVSNHTLETPATMWGSGTTAADAGASVTLECINCHNPHGNGNYRILRPYGFEGDSGLLASADIRNVIKEFNTVSAYSVAALEDAVTVGFNAGKYQYTVTTVETPTLVAGQPALIRLAGVGATVLTGTVYSVDYAAKTMVIGNSSQNLAAFSGTAYVMPNFPSTIIKVETTTTTGEYLYTTAAAMNLSAGQVITISTVNNSPSFYAVKQATVIAAPSTTTFRMAVMNTPAAGGMELGLYIDGIPDAKTVTDTTTAGTVKTNPGIPVGAAGRGDGKVYTTTNYYIADDPYYTGTYQQNENKTSLVSTPYIASVSQWCSSCHTRYLSDNRKMNGVAVTNTAGFGGYKHRSNSGSQGSPNCIQCHVAHGTSAQANGAQSSTMPTPLGVAGGATNSVLLRVDNRGICLMCHNPYGVS